MLKESDLHLRASFFWTVLALSVWTLYSDFTTHKLPALIGLSLVSHVFTDWNREEARRLSNLNAVVVILSPVTSACVPLMVLILAYDQCKLRSARLDEFFTNFSLLLKEFALTLTYPLAGNNNFSVPAKLWNEYKDNLRGFWKVEPDCEITYIRQNGIDAVPIDISRKPPIPAYQIYEKFMEISRLTRCVILGFFGLMALLMVGTLPALFVGLAYLANELTIEPGVQVAETNRGVMFKDGIYRVDNYVFGLNSSHGIGVAFGGVLHVPYHVNKGRPVRYGHTTAYPYSIDMQDDLVTYGGPSKISGFEQGDKVFVNTETEHSRTSYRVEAEYSRTKEMIAWAGVSKPGESGSPVYALRGEENQLHLLGLVGRYVREGDNVTEFTGSRKNYFDFEPMINKITLPPGAGKTFHYIPLKVDSLRLHFPNKRILVTGPTKVVCEELYNSLSQTQSVGLNISDNPNRNENAPVQIAAHRTALKLLVDSDRLVKNLGAILIDEAHIDSPETKLLRDMAEHKADQGVRLYLYSATLDGNTTRATNYTVMDSEIHVNQLPGAIQEKLEDGKRVMVFVPSLKNTEVKKLISTFRKYKPVELSREHYTSGMRGVKDVDSKLIFTTNIAECGINVPELDVVFDTGKMFTYVLQNGIITGETIPVNEASITQRRGRVGRTRIGEYITVFNPNDKKRETKGDKKPPPFTTASEEDANILGQGRYWSQRRSQIPIQLSDNQFKKWLSNVKKKDRSPLEIWYTTTGLGAPSNEEERKMKYTQMRSGASFHGGCGDSECTKCTGNYAFYDQRAHESIYGVQLVEKLD